MVSNTPCKKNGKFLYDSRYKSKYANKMISCTTVVSNLVPVVYYYFSKVIFTLLNRKILLFGNSGNPGLVGQYWGITFLRVGFF